MKKTAKRILPLLLAAVLCLGMASAVWADSATATRVTLNQTSATLYLHSGDDPRITLTATPTPADYTGDYVWSVSSGGNSVVTLSADYGRSITVTGRRTGSATVTVTLNGSSTSCAVTVANDEIEGCFLEKSSYALSPGATVQIVPVTQYKSGHEEHSATFTVDNTAVATVSGTGLLRGVAVGTTKVRATFPNGITRTATVTVGNGIQGTESSANNISASVTLGNTLSLHEIYNALVQRFTAVGGAARLGRISFSHVGNANYGHLYLSALQDTMIENGYEDDLSTVDSMVFVPEGEGDYVIFYSIEDNSAMLEGTITIRAEILPKNISFSVDERENYSFFAESREGDSALQLLDDTIGQYGSVRFGAVSAGSNVGTLYKNETLSRDNLVVNGTTVSSANMGDLYFVPSRAGVYRISYTAYNGGAGTGDIVAAGAISIVVGENSLNVTVSLDGSDAYTFANGTRRSADGAAAMLAGAIDKAVGAGQWGYLRFDPVSSESGTVGTLYERAGSASAISSGTYISSGDLRSLYFTPARPGTFEIGYSVYTQNDSTGALANGILRLVVPAIPYGSIDLYYGTGVNGTVSLSEDDFIRWYQDKHDTNYTLSHVVFDEYQNDYGSFYHNADLFVPYNSADYYTTAAAASVGTGARLLNNITFRAPATTGFQVVEFTCYGYVRSSGNYVRNSGVLYIFVTENEVPVVSYNVGNNVSAALTASEFSDAYRSAMNATAANPEFYIQLLNAPSRGTLYYDSTASGRSSVRMTGNNIGNYNFYVNGGVKRNSIGTLTYVAARNGALPETVRYIAYSTAGRELYIGTISFRYNADRDVVCTSGGMGFEPADLSSATGSNSIRYVVFKQPASGTLYVSYANGRGTELPSGARLYTMSAADGAYPLNGVTYIPKAGATGTVTLDYTVCTRAGDTYEDSVVLNLAHKTSSEVFQDVTPRDVGGWAADAIDFSSKWGLVNGTSLNPPYFSPRDTMRRCDLVLILYRIAGSPAVPAGSAYPDVSADAYYYTSALWAARNNLMTGVVTDGQYAPEEQITRQDFATILYNYTTAMGTSTLNDGSLRNYVDANLVSAYAVNAVTWAVARGYITSTSSTELVISPTATATRAEIATLLHRYLTY